MGKQRLSLGKILWLATFLLTGITCFGQSVDWSYAESAWQNVPIIQQTILPTTFPDQSFSILDFNAKGDGTSKNTEAIQQAIDACHEAGGGKVIVPAGIYHTGAIRLKSHVNLHLEEGAILSFSTDESDYLPLVHTHWNGMEVLNYSALILLNTAKI